MYGLKDRMESQVVPRQWTCGTGDSGEPFIVIDSPGGWYKPGFIVPSIMARHPVQMSALSNHTISSVLGSGTRVFCWTACVVEFPKILSSLIQAVIFYLSTKPSSTSVLAPRDDLSKTLSCQQHSPWRQVDSNFLLKVCFLVHSEHGSQCEIFP